MIEASGGKFGTWSTVTLFLTLSALSLSQESGKDSARAARSRRNDADTQIVNSFYPQSLIASAQAADPGEPFDRLSCFARLDESSIIAAYSNEIMGAVLLLTKTTDGYSATYQVSGLDLAGGGCSVTLVNTEHHKDEQAMVSFTALNGNTIDWVFERVEDKLATISPTITGANGLSDSSLSNSQFVNADRGLYPEIVSGGEYPPPADGSVPSTGMSVYRFDKGVYKVDPSLSVLFAVDYQHKAHSAQSITFHFQKPQNSTGPYVVKVANGDKHGQHRISGGLILINGQPVASFSSVLDVSSFDIQLQAENSLTIKPLCEAGDTVTVLVEPSPKSAP